MNSSRSYTVFMAELGEARLSVSQPTLTSCVSLASFQRGKLLNQKQPLDWSQMPRTNRGSQVEKVMFVQPSLVLPSSGSVPGSVDFGQVPKEKR